MKITEHFSLEEFHCKDGTPYPEEWIDERLKPLCELLEAIRGAIDGGPLHVISGYRSPEYNGRIGGAEKSQHMEGRAADIVSRKFMTAWTYQKIYEAWAKRADPRFELLGGLGKYPSFTHVDIRKVAHLVTWNG